MQIIGEPISAVEVKVLRSQKHTYNLGQVECDTWPKSSGLEIATDIVANATNIFSLVTKNSGLVTTLATRFLYDLDLN